MRLLFPLLFFAFPSSLINGVLDWIGSSRNEGIIYHHAHALHSLSQDAIALDER
jgi:hypothetical protein